MKDFLRRRRSALDPARFQGWGRRRRYFEGWYFKIVVPEEEIAYAFIPGISFDDGGAGHAFLQVLDGVAGTTAYHRYPTGAFRPATDRFYLELGPHVFSADRLRISLPELRVDVNFTQPRPWPKRWYAPGVMGWYGFVPRMQCYHGLVSLHHGLTGSIEVSGRLHDAAGGTGYAEKDWGSGFPDAWIWLQSNHLSGTDRPASLMCSVASIPWLGTSFTGFLSTFLFGGQLYTFTTWTGARTQVQWLSKQVRLTFRDTTHRLEVTFTPGSGGELSSPVTGSGMTGKINESLRGEAEVRFWAGEELVYAGVAGWAGVEVSAGARELL